MSKSLNVWICLGNILRMNLLPDGISLQVTRISISTFSKNIELPARQVSPSVSLNFHRFRCLFRFSTPIPFYLGLSSAIVLRVVEPPLPFLLISTISSDVIIYSQGPVWRPKFSSPFGPSYGRHQCERIWILAPPTFHTWYCHNNRLNFLPYVIL